jgi:hypothetical protein
MQKCDSNFKKAVRKTGSGLVSLLICFSFGVGITLVGFALKKSRSKQEQPLSVTVDERAPVVTQVPENSGYDELESLDPYDIRNFIDGSHDLDLTQLWERLRIKTINFSTSQKLDPFTFRYFQSCNSCRAEIFQYELDGQPGNEILLKISDEPAQACRYLVFGEVAGHEGTWKMLGHIDTAVNKYRMSQHMIFMGGGRSWLVINSQGASGTGIASYFDRVFLVEQGRVEEVLSYMSEGHQSSWPIHDSREFFGQLTACELKGNQVTAEVGFNVRYFGENHLNGRSGVLLWEKSQRGVFTTEIGQSYQVLDAKRSTVSERELDEVYNTDSLTEEGFFRFNSKELSEIASGDNKSKKEWLRQHLENCQDSTEKRRLTTLLNK